jgi:hypothetical protein
MFQSKFESDMKPTTKRKLVKAINIAVQALELKCGGPGGTPGPCPSGRAKPSGGGKTGGSLAGVDTPFKDLGDWKNQATRMGFTVRRSAIAPDGSDATHYTAKDPEGNHRGEYYDR